MDMALANVTITYFTCQVKINGKNQLFYNIGSLVFRTGMEIAQLFVNFLSRITQIN